MSSILGNEYQSPVEYVLSQAEFQAVARGFKVFHKYAPQGIMVKDSLFRATAHEGTVLLAADYSKLVKAAISGVFMPDKKQIKVMSLIHGVEDVRVRQDAGGCTFCGDHMRVTVPWQPLKPSDDIPLPKMNQFGTPLAGFDERVLKGVIGKKSGAVELAIYDNQLEQLGVGSSEIFTFTPGMAERLAQRVPDRVFKSQHAFRVLGPKPTIEVGTIGDAWVVKVTSSQDIQVRLAVMELLCAVSPR